MNHTPPPPDPRVSKPPGISIASPSKWEGIALALMTTTGLLAIAAIPLVIADAPWKWVGIAMMIPALLFIAVLLMACVVAMWKAAIYDWRHGT